MEMEILGMNFSCVLRSLSEWKIPDNDCLLPLISKLLGYCIVAASTTVKVPQILKILKHSSVRGLSVAAFELEVVGYTIALSYCLHKGLPFSAYGELFFLLIQAIILVGIIYYYSQPMGAKALIKAALYCAIAPTVLAGQIGPVLFEALYASQHAIFFFARVPQIWKNYTNKSTGELSFLTCFMNFSGSLVRVFTSIQEEAPKSGILRFTHKGSFLCINMFPINITLNCMWSILREVLRYLILAVCVWMYLTLQVEWVCWWSRWLSISLLLGWRGNANHITCDTISPPPYCKKNR